MKAQKLVVDSPAAMNGIFLSAVKGGDASLVGILAANKANVDKSYGDEGTPLMLAAERNLMEVSRILIKFKADVNKPVRGGYTPIYAAAQYAQVDMMKYLIENNADPNGGRFGVSPILGIRMKSNIAQNDFCDAIDALVEFNADVKQSDNRGFTALHCAACDGASQVAATLVRHKADLNAVTGNGATPIYLAARFGHCEVIRVLAEHKADLGIESNEGLSPLQSAAVKAHTRAVQCLVNFKADVNKATSTGATALWSVAFSGDEIVCKMLIDLQADVNCVDVDGVSPLCASVYKGHANIVKMLVHAGADVNLADSEGRWAISLAARIGDESVISCLVRARADIEAQTPVGKISRQLITSMMQTNPPNAMEPSRGLVENQILTVTASPLYFAVIKGHSRVVRTLIRAKADPCRSIALTAADRWQLGSGGIRFDAVPFKTSGFQFLLLDAKRRGFGAVMMELAGEMAMNVPARAREGGRATTWGGWRFARVLQAGRSATEGP